MDPMLSPGSRNCSFFILIVAESEQFTLLDNYA